MVINIQVEALKEPITPKPIPLVILEIGVGTKVILIDSITMPLKFLRLQI